MDAHVRKLALIGAGVLALLATAAVAVALKGRSADERPPVAANPEQTVLGYEQQLLEDQQELQQRRAESERRSQKPLAPGDKAPGFQLRGEDGKVSLADYAGRPLVIEFAQSSCPHCQNMASVFDGVMGAHPDVAYLIVGVGEPPSATRRWHRSFLGKPMRGDLAFDPDLKAARLYQVAGTPTTAFIGPDGKVKEIIAGEMNRDELERKVAQLAAS